MQNVLTFQKVVLTPLLPVWSSGLATCTIGVFAAEDAGAQQRRHTPGCAVGATGSTPDCDH